MKGHEWQSFWKVQSMSCDHVSNDNVVNAGSDSY